MELLTPNHNLVCFTGDIANIANFAETLSYTALSELLGEDVRAYINSFDSNVANMWYWDRHYSIPVEFEIEVLE